MNEPVVDVAKRRRARLQLIGVAAIFLGTPILAALLYAYGGIGHRGDTINNGFLIDPPRPVAGAAALGLLDNWTLTVIAPAGCAAGCEQTLVTLRQVRLTFDHDSERLKYLLVSGAAETDRARLGTTHPELRILAAEAGAALTAVTADLPNTGAPLSVEDGRAFLVDPLGNLMLTYAPDPAPKDVQSDLKRLLKNSETWMKR